ncbi:TolC family protein [Crateriforma spongiae]|uniref:TolC family protein n=1 Tax=Crateriforma spongiae TaxID=2724528 RepID=UPI001F17DFCC|nr:TolC family protein [Crateriforma spongiae]
MKSRRLLYLTLANLAACAGCTAMPGFNDRADRPSVPVMDATDVQNPATDGGNAIDRSVPRRLDPKMIGPSADVEGDVRLVNNTESVAAVESEKSAQRESLQLATAARKDIRHAASPRRVPPPERATDGPVAVAPPVDFDKPAITGSTTPHPVSIDQTPAVTRANEADATSPSTPIEIATAAPVQMATASPFQASQASSIELVDDIQVLADDSAPILIDNSAGVMPINLPSVLAMVGGRHPAVAVARWRVQEAYAELDQARALWLPTIQTGFSFHRHDGHYQASDGSIVDVNRNSFQYGLGAGATGAGTTPTPGLVARFHLADALFQPRIAKRGMWADGHAATATMNDQLRDVAVAYTDLLQAHQRVAIVQQSLERAQRLSKVTSDFAEAGEGLQADADRLATEVLLVQNRLFEAQEQVGVAAARLAAAASLDGGGDLIPTDAMAMPVHFGVPSNDTNSLVPIALRNRPELKEAQALVAQACEAHRRERYSPFVPSVLLGFSTGGFGGGLGNNLDQVDSRYDFDAALVWQTRNLGFGEHAARRRASAQVQQARYEKLRTMDQVAADVRTAASQVTMRSRQIDVCQSAIPIAQDSYDRNVSRIADGQGLPIEALQSIVALENAQQAYLDAVVGHNRAQFELQRALGWPVSEGM